MNYIGIDIGSTCAKVVVLDEQKNVCLEMVQPTGWSSVDTAEEIKKKLLAEGIDPDASLCVATGYGRVSVPYANKMITEITCHAMGALKINHSQDALVIDIGGQDTKIIRIEEGMVKDFIMNDKCSAGTGRFLEVMANSMGMRPDELCTLAEKQPMYCYNFDGKRYDVGNKLGFLQATVEYALARKDLGAQFRTYLKELLGE